MSIYRIAKFDSSYLYCTNNNCQSKAIHCAAINSHYSCIVRALQYSERASIPRIPHCALKPFWNEYLDELKQKSMTWHSIWLSAGRPLSGLIHKIKVSTKLKYKLAIKEAFIE